MGVVAPGGPHLAGIGGLAQVKPCNFSFFFPNAPVCGAGSIVMAMRSHYCGLVTEALMGQTVTLSGWVNRRRDHGGVIFIDLRDREGYVQVVCDPDRAEMFKPPPKACATSSACRSRAWCALAPKARPTTTSRAARSRFFAMS